MVWSHRQPPARPLYQHYPLRSPAEGGNSGTTLHIASESPDSQKYGGLEGHAGMMGKEVGGLASGNSFHTHGNEHLERGH